MDKKFRNKIILLVIGLILCISWLVIYPKYEKKRTTEAVNELVESGELTQEQADAVLWLWYEYKPRKYKKYERQN